MRIHKEGYTTIAIAFLLLAGLMLLFFKLIPIQALNYILLFAAMVVFGLILWFFRNPARKIVPAPGKILCPADGKVVVIEKTTEHEYFKDERIQVSVFMSPLNVHCNRYPVSGEVVYQKYHKGKYLVAWHPKSSTENERSTVVIKSPSGSEILVRQIAGAVARRIVAYSNKGNNVIQGNQLGFIKFGSRVDLFLPLNAKLTVALNQKVQANYTQIAELL